MSILHKSKFYIYLKNKLDNKIQRESFVREQLEKIQAFFETSPRLEHSFKVTNPNTGVESEYTLRGLASFFG